MTSKEFTIWLKGYIQGCYIDSWSDQLEAIENELKAVKDVSSHPTDKDEQDNWNIYNRTTTKAKDILHD